MSFAKHEIILKAMLVERPVAAALIGKLPGGVIGLVCEFIGLEKNKVADAINKERVEWLLSWGTNGKALDENSKLSFKSWLTWHATWKLRRIAVAKPCLKLRLVRSVIQRRVEFTKLRPWLRRFLMQEVHYLFPNKGKTNQRFIEEQLVELKMRRAARRNPLSGSFEW